MNSRIAIFNEARGRSIEFNKFFNRETILNYLIDMDNVSSIDKAKFSIPISISMEFLHPHFKELRQDKRYKNIVKHKNYTPRIIEFISEPHVLKKLTQQNTILYNKFFKHTR